MLNAKEPLVVFGNGLGDHLLVLPAMRALASLFPGRLTLVCMPGAQEIFFSDLPLRRVCEIRMESIRGGRAFDAEAVARDVGTADLLLSLNPWHSPAMAQLLRSLEVFDSIGFHQDFKTALPLDYNKHSAELAFDVPLHLDPTLRFEDFAGPPAISQIAWQKARELRSLLPESMRVLVVHADTGIWTSEGGYAADVVLDPAQLQIRGNKMWRVDRFNDLLDAFLARHRDIVAFVVGGVNLRLDRGGCGNRIIPCCGLPLDISLALIGQSDLFVGVDSCMLHAADLYRIPGVGLFGPTESHEFGFRFARHRHVSGGTTMDDIAVDDVLEALESLTQESNLN